MNKKSTLILLSILHICILGVCILTIYNNKHSGVTVAHVSFDTGTAVTPKGPVEETKPAEETEPKPDTVTTEEREPAKETEQDIVTAEEPEPEVEPEPEPPAETVQEPEDAALYSFRFTGKRSRLNVRSAPSMDAEIIAKVPVGGSGSVLELTDENWAQIEYDGTVGYCSRSWIELEEITE